MLEIDNKLQVYNSWIMTNGFHQFQDIHKDVPPDYY